MKNIVLIVADTLSAFHLPWHGYDRDTAPFLTELAEKNVLFHFAYANAPWTIPSHASLFSGELPSNHGATTDTVKFTADSVVEHLQSEGYTTLGFSNNPPLAAAGFDTGFDYFIGGDAIKLSYRGLEAFETVLNREQAGAYESKRQKYIDFLKEAFSRRDFSSLKEAASFLYREKIGKGRYTFVEDSGAAATNSLVQEELENVEEPFFLFINYMEPHEPYSPPADTSGAWLENPNAAQRKYDAIANLGKPKNIGIDILEDFRTDIISLYDAEIRHLDKKIEELYEHIDSRFDDTLFIITSDHGENIGHHDLWGHQYGIWERLLRVPLIIAGKNLSSKTVDKPVSLRDLPEFIRGEKSVENIGKDYVEAEYSGAFRFYLGGDEDKLGEYEEYAEKVLRNEARCRIDADAGAVRHSHLDDYAFKPLQRSAGEPLSVHDVSFFSEIEDFAPEMENLDI